MLIDFRELFPKYNIKPAGVLHIGANVGEEAPVYLALGVKKQIWIEANPELIPKLSATLSSNPEACFMRFAAGEENKPVILHVSNNAGQSSSILELGTHTVVHPDVHYTHDVEADMFRLDSFAPGTFDGCDFLNLDIQGAELMALRGMGTLVDQFKWIYTEVNKNEVYRGCATIDSVDLFMTAHRFKRVELYNNGGFFDRLGWSDALYIKD